jgi:general stress protein YciG
MAKKKTQRAKRRARSGTGRKLKMSTRRSMGGRRRTTTIDFGGMTVREAGRKGGLIGGRKGGLAVKAERGREFYQEIGRKGGQRVRDLIAAGRRTEERGGARSRRHS